MCRRLIFLIIFTVTAVKSAGAYTVNGQYLQLISCQYEFNSDFNQAGYVGTYKGLSNRTYQFFFPDNNHLWCPA